MIELEIINNEIRLVSKEKQRLALLSVVEADEFVAAYIAGRTTVKLIDLDNAFRNKFKRQLTPKDLSTCLKSFGWEKIRTTHERFWASPAEIEDRKTRARTAAENLAERKQRIFDLMAKIDRKNEQEKRETE